MLALLISCGGDEKHNKHNLYKAVVKTEKGIIRGVKINDNISQIKKQEKKQSLIEETAAFLEYEYTLKEESFLVVAYHFDEKGCSEINIDTYFDTEKQAKEVVELYQKHFNKKYGSPTIEDELLLWNDAKKAITIEVDFLDQADGEIMLTIFANE